MADKANRRRRAEPRCAAHAGTAAAGSRPFIGSIGNLMRIAAPLCAIAIGLCFGAANAQSPAPPDQPSIPTTGVNPRLTIVNQCTKPVWAILTPGGNPSQVASKENSGGWFRAYAAQEQFIGTGATAEPATDTMKVTLAAPPGDTVLYFHPGQFIEIMITENIQQSTPGPTAKITAVSANPVAAGTVLTLDQKLTVPPDPKKGKDGKAEIFVDTLTGALRIPSGGDKTFKVPDRGAPSGGFRFYTGCPKDDTDPFSQSGCTVGAANTQLAGINTLSEVSFGCMNKSDPTQPAAKSKCAFNPGNSGPTFPNCQANPNADNCGPLDTNDYYDVSAVDGYTFPLRVDVTAYSKPATPVMCNDNSGNNPIPAKSASIDGSMLDLSSCPKENAETLYSTDAAQQKLISGGISLLTKWKGPNQPDPNGQPKACVAPYEWFGQDKLGTPVDTSPKPADCANGTCTSTAYYAAESCDGTNPTTLKYFCPQHSGPQQRVGPHLVVPDGTYKVPDGKYSVHNTNYVDQLYAMGYKGYTWQFDDGVGLLNCPATAKTDDPAQYTSYTITVCPSGSTTDPSQPAQWVFSDTKGSCEAANGSVHGTAYNSLLLCQQAHMRYLCDDVTKYDPYQVPTALWRADAQATLSKLGYTWAQVEKLKNDTAPTCSIKEYPKGITPDFANVKVSLPLCTWYYGYNKLQNGTVMNYGLCPKMQTPLNK